MYEKRLKDVIDISNEERRQIQLIQLEILIEIDRVCRKNEIIYRIGGGTLLGAVRHKGFIPWDPDADVSMERKEYDKFFEACKKDLDKEKFFLQEWRTDPYYRWNYARVLRKNTVFVRAGHEKLKSKNGIFVDILCSDSVPDLKIMRPLHCFSCFAIRKILWSEIGKDLADTVFRRTMYKLLSFIPRDSVFIFRDWVIAQIKNEPSELYRNMAHKVSPKSPSKWGYPWNNDKETFFKVRSGELPYNYTLTELEFEGYMFYASKDYENSLRNSYGDYMKLPQKEERVSHIPCSKIKLIIPNVKNYDELIKKIYNPENDKS